MAKTTKKATSDKKSNPEKDVKILKTKKQYRTLFGFFLVLISVALLVSFISFFLHGNNDQSTLSSLTDRSEEVENWLGKFGAYAAELCIRNGFGVASFILLKSLFLSGVFLVLELPIKKLKNAWFWDLFSVIVLSIALGFFASTIPELGGTVGFEINDFLQDFIGKTGTLLLILFSITIYLLFKIKISPDAIKLFFEKKKSDLSNDLNNIESESKGMEYNLEEFAVADKEEVIEEPTLKTSQFEINKEALKPTIENASEINLEPTIIKPIEESLPIESGNLVIEKTADEEVIEENLAAKLVADFGEFDPTLELSNYKFPTIDLLKEYSTQGITINQAELEENKNKIVETLRNYKIDIAQIKATIGPSVT